MWQKWLKIAIDLFGGQHHQIISRAVPGSA
jgi:hypothetical protein